jgi:predicted Zn-ribbon and HTH transcriptional regulator
MITYDKPIRKCFRKTKERRTEYVYFRDANHPLASKHGYVFYHRHIMSIHIGRWLLPDEIVHHIDEDGTNNSIENLVITNRTDHAKHHILVNKEVKCEFCGIMFFPNRKRKRRFCSRKCQADSNFANKFLITREDLHREIWSMPITKVAEKYGVTDGAIHKRCKKLNIKKPPRDYWQSVRIGKINHKIPALDDDKMSTIDISKTVIP